MIKFILILFISLSAFGKGESKVELIDMRGMSQSERLAIINQIHREARLRKINPTDKSQQMIDSLKDKKDISPIQNFLSKPSYNEANQIDSKNKMSLYKIQSAMSEKDGDIEEYSLIDENTMWKDSYKKQSYLIKYKNGKTQEIEFIYVKPTVSGGYELTEINVK